MKTRQIFGALALTTFLIACDSENYLKFDSDYSGIYFNTDSTEYSFGVTPVSIKEYLLKIPVQIMGAPTKESRTVGFELITDLCEATEEVQYKIEESVVPADSIYGYISVRILRDGLTGNYVDGYETCRLYLRLVENAHFTPTLDSLSQVHLCKFNNAVEQPGWYNSAGEKVWLKGSLGVWHPYKYIKMVEYFHAIDTIQPLTYKKMVELYGENLEHIPGGNPMQYETIFKRYIYKPLYDHLNDPANREIILAQYPGSDPNHIFDFPNPFPSTNE